MSDVFLASRLQTAMGDAYRLERELPGGGMSRLFVAMESSLNRRVVIKVLPPELTSDVSAARFKQEIELAAHLQHPHILPILAAGSKDDLLYYVMPFVAGESLRQHLASGPMPIGDAVRILREVADALAYAHRKGIVHRDIKPENILLEEGHAVLADFGVARAIDEARSGAAMPRVTGTGMSVGTPTYMAPEQASGERHIDARADLYALAVVGYEMLAGKLPFTAPSPQAMLAAHLTAPPPAVTKTRPDVPAPVATAISKALAKTPDERYATAEEFRDALDPAAAAAGGGGRKRWIGIGIAAAVLVAGAALLATFKSRPKLDDHVLAVAPFDVLDPDLKLWHEGMVDVLSRNLDGAGEMRSVSPSLVIKRWNGRADRASAAELGLATGARYAVFGSLLKAGDSVSAKVSVLDVRTGRIVGNEIERRDVPARIDRLSDSLTFALVQELSHTNDLGARRLSALGTSSLPALKAYLLGEQYYRRSEWDSAAAAYQRAVDIDSTFAIADGALGMTYGWIGGSGDTLSNYHFARAGRHNHGLSTRDSLVIGATAIEATIAGAQFNPHYLGQARQMFAMFERAAQLYPDDPTVWYELGDARFHFGWGPKLGVPMEKVMQPFDRSIAADSSFLPAYIHAVALAYAMDGERAGRHYVAAYLAQRPTGMDAQGIAIAGMLADSAQSHAPETQQALDAASNDVVLRAQNAVIGLGDSAEVVVRILRALSPNKPAEVPRYGDAKWEQRRVGMALLHRGHFAEGRKLMGGTHFDLVIAAVLGAFPDDTVMQLWHEDLKDATRGCPPCFLMYWATRRDTVALRRGARELDSALKTFKGFPPQVAVYQQKYAEAMFSLARGDSASALRQIEALPDSICYGCSTSEITHAQLLEALHRDRDALAVVSVSGAGIDAYSILLTLERGRIAERLGEKEIAVDSYSRVAGMWQNGDAVLQPYVKEARAALMRLGGEHAKGIPIAGAPSSQ